MADIFEKIKVAGITRRKIVNDHEGRLLTHAAETI